MRADILRTSQPNDDCRLANRRPLIAIVLAFAMLCCTHLSFAQETAFKPLWPRPSLIVRGQAPDFEAGAEFQPEPEAEFAEDEEDHIETDRDSFTPATTTAAAGRSILEAAYSFIDNRNRYDTHSFPESLLRYGLNDRFELRLGWNYEVGGAASPVSGSSIGEIDETARLERESELTYGLKAGLFEQDGWVPRTAVIAHAFTPTSGVATTTDFVTTIVSGWEFSNRWQLDGALRYGQTTEEKDHFNQWSPSVVLKIPAGDKWYGHVEYFGILSAGRAEEKEVHFISPGVHYLVTRNLEVGIRVGWGLNHDASNFFNNVGVGWRF